MSDTLDAQKIVGAIDVRIAAALGSAGRVNHLTGVVASIEGQYYNVYLQGDTVASEGFRVKNGIGPDVGDRVIVAIDKEKDDRWIEEVQPSSEYFKTYLNPANGGLEWGDGTGATDVALSRNAQGELAVTSSAANKYTILRTIAPTDVEVDDYTGFLSQKTGDAAGRIFVGFGGDLPSGYTGLSAGDGTGGRDTAIYRTQSGIWESTGEVKVKRGASTNSLFSGYVSGDSVVRWYTRADGYQEWGPGNAGRDTNLYRGSGGNNLKTDDLFTAMGGLAIGTTSTPPSSVSLLLGADVNLYRSAQDNLRTDDLFMAGTSFPGSPLTGLRFFRTDLGMEFYYDGTLWLSTQLFTSMGHLGSATSTMVGPLYRTAATDGQVYWRFNLEDHGGSDIYVCDFWQTFYVYSGGTALSGSHYWNCILNRVAPDNTATAITGGTLTITSGSVGTWYKRLGTINATLGTLSSYPVMVATTDAVGTPGDLNVSTSPTFSYRVVAT